MVSLQDKTKIGGILFGAKWRANNSRNDFTNAILVLIKFKLIII